SEIEDLADGRIGIRCDLDEIETGLLCHLERSFDRNRPVVLAFAIDELDAGNPDFRIGARSFLGRLRRSVWSANGRILLKSLTMMLADAHADVEQRMSIAQYPREITVFLGTGIMLLY